MLFEDGFYIFTGEASAGKTDIDQQADCAG